MKERKVLVKQGDIVVEALREDCGKAYYNPPVFIAAPSGSIFMHRADALDLYQALETALAAIE